MNPIADPPTINPGAVRDARCKRDLIGLLAADFVACYDPAEAVDILRHEHPRANDTQLCAALCGAAGISAAVADPDHADGAAPWPMPRRLAYSMTWTRAVRSGALGLVIGSDAVGHAGHRPR